MSGERRLQFAGQGDDGPVATRENPIMFFDAKNGNGPYFHVCGGLAAVRGWLDRQITIGGVTGAERDAIERVLSELTDDAVADAAYNSILPPDWHKEQAAAPESEPTP